MKFFCLENHAKQPVTEKTAAAVERDTFEDTKRARWEAEGRRAQAKLAEALAIDKTEEELAREFKPEPHIVLWPAGEFLKYNDHEIPRQFIESIVIANIGRKPLLRSEWQYLDVEIGRASIVITLSSGRKWTLDCSRHHVEALHAALDHAWKHGKAKPAK